MPAPIFGWAKGCHSRERMAKVISLLTQERELTYEAMIRGGDNEGPDRYRRIDFLK